MEEEEDFELVAAALRSDVADSSTFLQVLAGKLAEALPRQTQVRQKGGLFGKKTVSEIEVDLGDVRYRLADQRGRLAASRQKLVRGIVLKSEQTSLEEWLQDLSRSMTEEARVSEAGSEALRRMLEG